MSDDDDDYLSDRFLIPEGIHVTQPKTYSDIRKEALNKSTSRNEQNRTKSRKQLEQESRTEGLNKNLFAKAKEEEAAGLSSGNKAISMMMKMGFTPGQSLGRADGQESSSTVDEESSNASPSRGSSSAKHKIEPIPLNEWDGAS
jgi:hypothetical protein